MSRSGSSSTRTLSRSSLLTVTQRSINEQERQQFYAQVARTEQERQEEMQAAKEKVLRDIDPVTNAVDSKVRARACSLSLSHSLSLHELG